MRKTMQIVFEPVRLALFSRKSCLNVPVVPSKERQGHIVDERIHIDGRGAVQRVLLCPRGLSIKEKPQ